MVSLLMLDWKGSEFDSVFAPLGVRCYTFAAQSHKGHESLFRRPLEVWNRKLPNLTTVFVCTHHRFACLTSKRLGKLRHIR